MNRKPITTAMFAVVLMVLGCSSKTPKPPPGYPVTGTVAYNGAPLAEGTITFYPENIDGFPPPSAPIRGGAFTATVPAGKRKVWISSTKPGSKKAPSGDPIPEEVLPPQYNTKTNLTADISSSGPNELKFDLKK